jgi:hypothetical protein
MPRLTSNDYLAIRNQLILLWKNNQSRLGTVSGSDQSALHSFFRPADQLADDEALAHRARITEAHPSLPQRAGRAYRHLQNPVHQPAFAVSSKGRVVTARAVRRPQPDLEAFRKAMLLQAWFEFEALERQQDQS